MNANASLIPSFPAKLGQELFEINAHMVSRFVELSAEELQRSVQSNAEFLNKVSSVRDPAEILAMQREYGESMARGVREALEARGELIRTATTDAARAFRSAFEAAQLRTGDTVAQVANAVTAVAEPMAESVVEAVEEVTEVVAETVRTVADNVAKSATPDDLTKINGVGPKFAQNLNKLGIVSFDQVANLKLADLDNKSHPLHALKGRIEADDWISKARALRG